mmetsp:Transcript_14904/g.38074  ORF Transcript_14904/g.38074 Transcript_14904/m.38074 type:complete len:326 (+) Transcript_14904:699-1676(+)
MALNKSRVSHRLDHRRGTLRICSRLASLRMCHRLACFCLDGRRACLCFACRLASLCIHRRRVCSNWSHRSAFSCLVHRSTTFSLDGSRATICPGSRRNSLRLARHGHNTHHVRRRGVFLGAFLLAQPSTRNKLVALRDQRLVQSVCPGVHEVQEGVCLAENADPLVRVGRVVRYRIPHHQIHVRDELQDRRVAFSVDRLGNCRQVDRMLDELVVVGNVFRVHRVPKGLEPLVVEKPAHQITHEHPLLAQVHELFFLLGLGQGSNVLGFRGPHWGFRQDFIFALAHDFMDLCIENWRSVRGHLNDILKEVDFLLGRGVVEVDEASK